jgi:NAD(P)-dependent dehydrogenase (short-subunit alcohol dehydrogenase family)
MTQSPTPGRLADRVAVVTGGANGIGRACAERLAGDGAAVVIADVIEDRAQATAADIAGGGGQAVAVRLDAASRDDNEAMAQLAIDRFGRLDICVTAAGISHGEYLSGDLERDLKRAMSNLEHADQPHVNFLDESVENWQRVIDVNLTGTLFAMQACASRMIDGGRGGAIVTFASIAARDPDAGPLAYTVSKAGVAMLTKKSARMLAKAGIRVNSVGPGFIDTNMTALVNLLPQENQDQLLVKIPMGRRGAPAEVASLVAFLASDDASYITGELIHPDGGWYTD